LGGKVAMQAALSYPKRVAKLVVADIAPVRYVQSHSPIIEALGVIDQSEISDRKEADSILARYESDPGVRGFLLQNLLRGEDGKYRLRLNLSAIGAHYFQELMAAPEGDRYDQPTLFIKGENSAYIQNKHRYEIRRLFPQSSVEVISGTGHWLHAEKPREFNQLVEQFMRGADVHGPLVW
jgi:esterase